MRSFSKNKFLCFRPVVDIDCMLNSEVAPHRSSPIHFSRHPTSEKQQMVKNSQPKSVYFHHVSPKRTISRVIKAVFYETILVSLRFIPSLQKVLHRFFSLISPITHTNHDRLIIFIFLF